MARKRIGNQTVRCISSAKVALIVSTDPHNGRAVVRLRLSRKHPPRQYTFTRFKEERTQIRGFSTCGTIMLRIATDRNEPPHISDRLDDLRALCHTKKSGQDHD